MQPTRNTLGLTPFLQAVASWKYPEARRLLDQGAAVNEAVVSDNRTLGGTTALIFALGCFDDWFLDERSPGRGFDREFLEFLLRAGVNINAQNITGKTALHLVLSQRERLEFLLTHGADPNLGDEIGWTPLHLAGKHGCTEACAMLCRHGAQLELTDQYGFTPLLLAASGAIPATINELIRLGANLQARLPNGQMAQHLAAGSVNGGQTAAVLKALIEAGARLDVTDDNGFTPLHCSALGYSPEAVQLLLANGADRAARSVSGMTALDLALRYQKEAVARVLRT